MQISFSGKTALVTGAGSGIGEAIALELGRAGARVIVADLHPDTAAAVADRIVAAGGQAQPGASDVSDPAVVERLVAEAVAAGGRLDLLVNNAGISGPMAPLGEYPLEGWRQVMGVNLDAVFYGLRFAIPEMLKSGGGAIVNMASILGSVGFANAGAYVAAKHALLGLTRTAALEYAAKGIRVNAVGPAFIDTPLLANLPEGAKEALVAVHPVGRLGQPAEVAALTLFLLSDQAKFINGSYHLIDGGYCAQ
ncbi:MAG: short-chain dehydrogenase [Rhodobacterales bacterium 65-51]|uniref:SDR family NAD(P)-dependent oxidoreductase n=1 Tax=uncultured Gemmobacter sp. TaxID=1095917 RepID=UPI00095F086E|nr:SDR family NAD(P)-dependent oxidoreductase [uncultured Gemmobacter sp.]OJY33299.1 MAG: short-chain dehydrogenase [Rhodobacterales bacterium 65-51]